MHALRIQFDLHVGQLLGKQSNQSINQQPINHSDFDYDYYLIIITLWYHAVVDYQQLIISPFMLPIFTLLVLKISVNSMICKTWIALHW